MESSKRDREFQSAESERARMRQSAEHEKRIPVASVLQSITGMTGGGAFYREQTTKEQINDLGFVRVNDNGQIVVMSKKDYHRWQELEPARNPGRHPPQEPGVKYALWADNGEHVIDFQPKDMFHSENRDFTRRKHGTRGAVDSGQGYFSFVEKAARDFFGGGGDGGGISGM